MLLFCEQPHYSNIKVLISQLKFYNFFKKIFFVVNLFFDTICSGCYRIIQMTFALLPLTKKNGQKPSTRLFVYIDIIIYNYIILINTLVQYSVYEFFRIEGE